VWAASDIGEFPSRAQLAFRDLMAARGQTGGSSFLDSNVRQGFALVAAEIPELRRIYLRLPWPHL